MVRIWAKVIREDKIIKDTIFEKFDKFNEDEFFDYISEITNKIDICTPIILKKHLIHYTEFNTCTFIPEDFPEEVDFDKFVLEEASNY